MKHLVLAIWSLLCVFPGLIAAADSPRVYPIRKEVPERGEVPGYVLVSETNSFSFIPPPGWTPQGRLNKKQVLFLSPELDASLSFQILSRDAETNATAQPKSFAEQIAERMPEGEVVGTFPCVVANYKGLGLDFEEVAADKSKIYVRAAWIPLPCGVGEFIFRAPKSRIGELRLAFARFLASVSQERHSPRK